MLAVRPNHSCLRMRQVRLLPPFGPALWLSQRRLLSLHYSSRIWLPLLFWVGGGECSLWIYLLWLLVQCLSTSFRSGLLRETAPYGAVQRDDGNWVYNCSQFHQYLGDWLWTLPSELWYGWGYEVQFQLSRIVLRSSNERKIFNICTIFLHFWVFGGLWV